MGCRTKPENIIQIERIDQSSVTGIRQSDNKETTTPIDSLLLSQIPKLNTKHEKRSEFENDWLLEPFTRVVCQNRGQDRAADGRLMLLGYLIKWSHNKHTIKLLGGELAHLGCYLLEPTEADLTIFEHYENDENIIRSELERTRQMVLEKCIGLDLGKAIDVRKLVRFLANRGCREVNIQACLKELQYESLELIA